MAGDKRFSIDINALRALGDALRRQPKLLYLVYFASLNKIARTPVDRDSGKLFIHLFTFQYPNASNSITFIYVLDLEVRKTTAIY
jgi:hypothetical protein